MAWDGMYRSKVHHVSKVGGRILATCGLRFVKRKSPDAAAVTCFSCLKRLGVIK